jgi:hypothetical protein
MNGYMEKKPQQATHLSAVALVSPRQACRALCDIGMQGGENFLISSPDV